MLRIAHRINDPDLLAATPVDFGVETDLHALGERLVVHHDAFADGVDFAHWLDCYRHRFAIFNVKEEGIETRARDMAVAVGIKDFFMLDLSFPALMKMARSGERRIAARVSEYEPVAGALALKGMVEWVWLDVFRGFPIAPEEVDALKTAGFKLCLVSPELHGRKATEIDDMQAQMAARGITVDAVCTKLPDRW